MVETVLSHSVCEFKSSLHLSVHMLQHIEQIHRDGTVLGFREVASTVDVPAEEMMFHQHVLNAFLQRPLLLLLGKKNGKT